MKKTPAADTAATELSVAHPCMQLRLIQI